MTELSPLCSVPWAGTIPEGLKPGWHHQPQGEPSWFFPILAPPAHPSLGRMSRSVCANTFQGTEQPGGSAATPSAFLEDGSGSCSDHQEHLQISSSFWRAERGLALTQPGSPQPGMLPSQPHSHLVNGLIRYCKEQRWPELGFTRCSAWLPVSCLSLQQWSGGCPFHEAGRSMACCPAAKEKSPHIRKPEQSRAHPLSRSHSLPTLGHVHVVVALAQ